MAKKQDFASKAAKMAKHGKACPVCGEFFSYMKTVNMVPSDKTSGYRFSEQHVAVCKCNEKQIFG
jgi:hypothetical protein